MTLDVVPLQKPLSLEVLFLEAIIYNLIRVVVSKAVRLETGEDFVLYWT